MALTRRLLVLVIVLAIPVIAVELLARKLVGDAVASAVQDRIGTSAHVDFGSTPLLVQLARGRLTDVSVHARGARIGGLPPVGLTASLRDVHMTDLTRLEGAIGSLSVDASLAPAAVRELLATSSCIAALPADVAATLTAHPRIDVLAGRIDLLPPSGRAVEVRMRPVAAPTAVSFTVTGLSRDGVPVATAAVAPALLPRCGRSLPDLPFGVSLRSATAANGALELSFAGSNASFSAIG